MILSEFGARRGRGLCELGTESGEQQETKMAQSFWLEGRALLPPVFCKSIIPNKVEILCFDRLLKVYDS